MQVQIPAEWYPDGVSLYPELVGDTPLEKNSFFAISIRYGLQHPLRWPPVSHKRQTIKYYWDGRFYNVSNDLNEENPLDVSHLSEEVQTVYTMLKTKVDEFRISIRINQEPRVVETMVHFTISPILRIHLTTNTPPKHFGGVFVVVAFSDGFHIKFVVSTIAEAQNKLDSVITAHRL